MLSIVLVWERGHPGLFLVRMLTKVVDWGDAVKSIASLVDPLFARNCARNVTEPLEAWRCERWPGQTYHAITRLNGSGCFVLHPTLAIYPR